MVDEWGQRVVLAWAALRVWSGPGVPVRWLDLEGGAGLPVVVGEDVGADGGCVGAGI